MLMNDIRRFSCQTKRRLLVKLGSIRSIIRVRVDGLILELSEDLPVEKPDAGWDGRVCEVISRKTAGAALTARESGVLDQLELIRSVCDGTH